MQDLYNPLYVQHNPFYLHTGLYKPRAEQDDEIIQDLYTGQSSLITPTSFTPSNPRDYGAGIEISRTFPFDEWEGFDYLANKYPRFKDTIFQLRSKGISDELIEQVFTEDIEPNLAFAVKPSEVNAWLGRTEQSMQLIRDYEYYKRHQLYKNAFPDKSNEDIFTAEGLSQHFGISTSTLLSNPELTKKLTEGLKVRESWRESARRNWLNYFNQREIANIGYQYLLGRISKDEAFKKEQELMKNYLPDPIVPTFGNQFVGGGAKVLAQAARTGAASLLVGGISGGLGAVMGGSAGGIPGAVAGWKMFYNTGALLAAANELFQLQAGADMLEFSKLTDENGQPIGERAARTAAIITGAITVGTELYGLSRAAKLIPGLDKVLGLGGLQKQHVIDALRSNPIVREAFEQLALDTAKGIGWGTINNIIETLGHDLGGVLAEKVSGQPFPKRDLGQFLQQEAANVGEATTSSIRDFTASAIPGLLFGIAKLNIGARQYRLSLAQLSKQTGIPETQLETIIATQIQQEQQAGVANYNNVIKRAKQLTQGSSDFIETITGRAEQQVTQASSEATATQEAQTQPTEQTVPQAAEQTTTPPVAPDTQEVSQPVTQEQPAEITPPQETSPATTETSQEQQVQTEQPQTDKPSYYFIPRADFEQYYLPKHPEAASMQVIYTDNEVGLTAEQFEQITTEDPGFRAIIGNDIRQDADGTTLTEAIEKIQNTDPAEAEAFHSPENQQAMQQFAQRLVDAGTPQQEAQDIAAITGALSASFMAQEGVPPMQIDVTTSEAIEAQRSDMSRLNPDYDINNPLTWTDQNRAQRLLAAGERSGLSTTDKLLKGFIEKLIGKGEKSLDTEQENLTPEQLAERTTMAQELRAEAADYTRTLTTANQDAIDTIRARTDLDPERYEIGGKFPRGKSRNPDALYTHEDYSGTTKIAFAIKKNDLVIKVSKGKTSSILTVKNFRDANFSDVVQDLTQGETVHGVQVSETPVGMYLVNALTDFWSKQGLPKVAVQSVEMAQPIDIHTEDFSIERPQVHTEDLSTPERVPTYTQDFETPERVPVHSDNADFHADGYPEVHGEIIQEPQIQVHSLSSEQIQELDRTLMPTQARYELAQDEAAWRQTVDRILADETITEQSRTPVPVMRYTPQVFTLVGAENKPVYINNGKVKLNLRDHKGMTPDMLKNILSHIVDPVAIFQSKSEGKHDAKVVLTEAIDETGASVLAAFHLNYDHKGGSINKFASTYGKEADGIARNSWFTKQVEEGRLLYIDPVKAKRWTERTGQKLLPDGAVVQTDNGTEISIDGRQIKTRDDLINLWQQHKQEGLYKTDPETGENLARTMFRFGKSVIEVMNTSGRGTNYAVFTHEIGHVMFNMMDKLARDGSIQMQQDLQVILDHAGVTQEAWDADTNGARKKAHEWFANAFEVYLSEGRAPNKKLQGVFTRIKNYLLKFYNNITQQLGVELDDDVRAVFDRLFTMPNKDSSVEQIAINDARIEQQKNADRARIRAEKAAEAQAIREFYEEQDKLDFKHQVQQERLDEIAMNEPELYQYYINLFQELEDMGVETSHLDPEAMEQVYNYDRLIQENEEASAGRRRYGVHKEVDKIYKAIRRLGYISGKDVERLIGSENAAEIRKKWTRLWSGPKHGEGKTLLDLASSLYHMGFKEFEPMVGQSLEMSLVDWLRESERTYPLFPNPDPTMKVNEALLDSLLAQIGSKGAVEYLKARKKYLTENLGMKNFSPEKVNPEIETIDKYIAELSAKPAKKAPTKKKGETFSLSDLRTAARSGYSQGRQQERTTQKILQEIAQAKTKQQKEEALKKLRDKQTEWREAREKKYQQQRIDREKKISDKYQRKISRLQERIDRLTEWQEKRSQKREVQRMVKSIFRMSKGKNIKVERLLDIKELLENYNLSRKGQERRADIDTLLKFIPDLSELTTEDLQEYGIDELTLEDIHEFLSKIHIEDMTPAEVKALHKQVEDIYKQGKTEFQQWKAENEARMLELRAPLVDTIIKNTKDPEKRTITDRNDLVRKYVLGPIGDMMQTYWDAVITPGRFLQYVLGDGFREVFGDGFTERRGEADRHIHARTTAVQEQLKQLGFHIQDFLGKAITVDGQDYTWTEVQAIYLGMQNPRHREAILWGNFVNNALNPNKLYATEEEGLNAINQILAFINRPENERYRLAAELAKNDFDANFDRLRETQIRDFNRDLNHEENYSPMYRLAHVTAQGLIDAEAENLARTGDHSALMQKVTDNFTISRKKLGKDKQAPVSLDLWNNWKRAVQEQEYQINLGRYAADVMSALFSVGEQGTLADLIKKRVGQPAWDTLRSIFNDSIHDHNVLESDAASKVAQWLISARSFAYVAFDPIAAIAQTGSLLAGIRDASARNLFSAVWKGKDHLFRTIFKALHMADTGQADAFIESVLEKCPELRFSGGDPDIRALRQRTYEDASEYNHNVTRALARGSRTIQRYAYEGVGFFDLLTKCMVFDAAYQTAIEKGMTEQEAITYGRRAVQDTQPASHVSEQARFTRGYGISKLFFSQFMNALVPIFNMSVVDVVYNLKAKNWNAVKAAGWALAGGVLGALAVCFIKDLANGKLPSGEELDSGETDSWEKWLYDSSIEGLLNTFPLFNFILVNAFRGARGNKTYRAENRWFEPLQSLGRGFFGTQSNTDEDFTGWNLDNIIKGASLLGAPIPYSAGKRLLKFFVGSDEE